MKKSSWIFGFSLALAGLFIAAVVYLAFTPAPEAQSVTPTDISGGTQYAVQTGVLAPTPDSALATQAPQLSRSQKEALYLRKLQIREQMAAQVDNNPPSPPGLPPVTGRETQVGAAPEAQFGGLPSSASFILARNNRNTNANNPLLGSTLAEPAAANNARVVFAAGNFDHAEYSTDGGVNWENVALPAGTSFAPEICCDHDVVIDDGRRVVFHSTLYINSTLTRGVVRIFVRRSLTGAAACSYDIFANNDPILRDYPHIGLTRDHLWLGTNEIGAIYPGGQAARMYRFNIDQMVECQATPFAVFQLNANVIGQRIFVPVGGADLKEQMYWGIHVNATTLRIYRWGDADAAPTFVNKARTATAFTDPDCRGGTGNFDYIRSIDTGAAGFSIRGAVGHDKILFQWMSGPVGTAQTQGHIRSAAFALNGPSGTVGALIAQPHVFNNSQCFGFPVVTANKRGDFGMSFAFGGRTGGGGSAAQGGVGLDDDFTTGVGNFQLVATASGTHNREDGRFGDYFTIHPYEPCEKFFSATNYARSGGTALANINSRYVEFGRGRDKRCYDSHANQYPETTGSILIDR
jgi:hypothetical protein